MVRFFNEDVKFDINHKTAIRSWLKFVAESEVRRLGEINIIFCSDRYILDINIKFLSHDYYTDIITFDYCEKNILSGDLFISVDSVRENADFYNVDFSDELNRVMVHGLLHLIGYDDKTDEERKTMREKENQYLSFRKNF